MHYYTLTTITSSQLTTANNTIPIRIDRVTIPAELDRAQLVRRLDATRLQIIEGDRWAAPLEDTIRRTLSDDLAARLPPNMVANPYEPSAGEKRQSLEIDIGDFYGDASCTVTLRAAWVLKQPDNQSSRGAEQTQFTAPPPCSSAAIPPAMSEALAQLADKLASALTH
jgi:uncharacterized lipoprotein YmbA